MWSRVSSGFHSHESRHGHGHSHPATPDALRGTQCTYLEGGDLVVKNVFGGLVGSHPLGYRVGAQVVGHDFDRRAGPGLMQHLKNEEEVGRMQCPCTAQRRHTTYLEHLHLRFRLEAVTALALDERRAQAQHAVQPLQARTLTGNAARSIQVRKGDDRCNQGALDARMAHTTHARTYPAAPPQWRCGCGRP